MGLGLGLESVVRVRVRVRAAGQDAEAAPDVAPLEFSGEVGGDELSDLLVLGAEDGDGGGAALLLASGHA